MNIEKKISEIHFMLFNEMPDSVTLESLLKVFSEHNDSLDYVENSIRDSEKFKNLSKKLEIELEISELYYSLLNRKPDTEGFTFFKNQIFEHDKSLDWISETIKNSDEYNRKQKADFFNKQNIYIFEGDFNLKYNIHPNSVLDFLVTQNGICNMPLIKQMKNSVSLSGIIFDIGANSGLVSLPIAKHVVPEGKVFSFEPDSELYHHLCENVKLNNLKNIHTEKLAIQDDPSLTSIQLHKRRATHDDGRINYGLSTIQENPEYVIDHDFVDTTTIDNYIFQKKILNIDLIKIDVEGAEFRVLTGAKNSISKFHPIIIYEFSCKIDQLINTENSKNSFEYLKEFGYQQYEILNNGQLSSILSDYDHLTECDILAIPSKQ